MKTVAGLSGFRSRLRSALSFDFQTGVPAVARVGRPGFLPSGLLLSGLLVSCILLGAAGPAAAAELTHGSVGVGHGIAVPGGRSNPCNGTLQMNYDGSAEDGYCWSYGGIAPPQYGAFAECYSTSNGVCGIELALTSIGYSPQPATLFIWNDDHGLPGNVLARANVTPANVPMWPAVGTYDYPIGANVTGSFWTGYWADFSAGPCGYYIAADLDGFGGCPLTYIAPGLGYPSGWTNVGLIWSSATALGIGAWTGGCLPGSPGACCLPDGSCTVGQLGPCENGGGIWYGCTSCSPDPCPLAGACCIGSTCTLRFTSDCQSHGGIYLGGGTVCNPNPCGPNSSVGAGDATSGDFGGMAAFPNPSSGEVLILYRLHRSADVTIEIFDASGAVVRRLAQGSQDAGSHTIRWSGRDDAGARSPAGTYFVRSRAAGGTTVVKVVLTR